MAIYSLGCKVNQVESEQIKAGMVDQGYQVVPWGEPAEVLVINTCSVTHVGERKSRALLRRARRLSPDALVIACGCLAQEKGETLKEYGVDLVVGNQDKDQLPELLNQLLQTEAPIQSCQVSPFTDRELLPVLYANKPERTRAMIKIQDGCGSRCSYCIVSVLRGPVVVKPPSAVVEEGRHLLDLGYEELVFTGIHIGQYHHAEVGGLTGLVEYFLREVPGNYRLRLGSIEMGEITPRLLHLIASEERLCRHLHIPLQSGSDEVLARMNRNYDRHKFASRVQQAVQLIPGLNVSVDVMVGFPGENELDFARTVGLVSSLPLVHAHIFRYSKRPGTPAAAMPGQISEKLKEQRAHLLDRIASQRVSERARLESGRELVVLVEEVNGDVCSGLADNYWRVSFTGAASCDQQRCRVSITGTSGEGLIGEYLGSTDGLR
ncbi:MAG: tRNA (N(6)-L-threonylcarbamoyladenosine(37)-C(2))-methylthiotransferase MtaB [Methylocystaceae bacterium]